MMRRYSRPLTREYKLCLQMAGFRIRHRNNAIPMEEAAGASSSGDPPARMKESSPRRRIQDIRRIETVRFNRY